MKNLKIGVSPLTNRIYVGKTKKYKKGIETWTDKEDMTIQCIGAVYEHMMNKLKKTDGESQQVRFGDLPYVLEMRVNDERN